jgi:hypothetical protein
MLPELIFIGVAIACSSLAYGLVLPRLASNPIEEVVTHSTRPTLVGSRFAAWVALMAVLGCAFAAGYGFLREYRQDFRLYAMCLAVSIIFVLFRSPSARARERDPDVRFGTFVGTIIGVVAYFIFLYARH